MTDRIRYTSPLLGSGLFLGRVAATGAMASLTGEQIATIWQWWVAASRKVTNAPVAV
ncbi:hypothetical protein HII28_13540 [Planctomonas sp. JC2975]|uniref:hypothetical protein n=1 Tax=Planctomonas sp. JC2975 TaxID=2729626 RepID=UPI001473F710|nr:hypothetical protein [Planctomonas sp. JC2975]NNC12894.1 hypothetical protein [Planctomonas sp. JC2975]